MDEFIPNQKIENWLRHMIKITDTELHSGKLYNDYELERQIGFRGALLKVIKFVENEKMLKLKENEEELEND